MSTYYYLLCDDHKEYCAAASSASSHHSCDLSDSYITLSPFIAFHASCRLRLVDEHSEDLTSCLAWTKWNVKKLFDR